jgi:hypothetical protein
MISAVIATLNDEARLGATLSSLAPAAMDGFVREVIVADSGSTDATLDVAEDAGARVVAIENPEMAVALGCDEARQPWLLILQPGARLQVGWDAAALVHMRDHPQKAGWFQLALAARGPAARLTEAAAGLGGHLLGRPREGQGLLISKSLYAAVGGPAPTHAQLIGRLGRGRLRSLGVRALA